MHDRDVRPLAARTHPEVTHWADLLPWIESVCLAFGGYFILKIDGERAASWYTAVVNTPHPSDIVLRHDGETAEAVVTKLAADLETALASLA